MNGEDFGESSPSGGLDYQSNFAPKRMIVGPMIVTGKR